MWFRADEELREELAKSFRLVKSEIASAEDPLALAVLPAKSRVGCAVIFGKLFGTLTAPCCT